MKKILATLAFCTAFATQAWTTKLIVIENLGDASALPYYQDLDPQPSAAAPGPDGLGVHGSGAFPIYSVHLSPDQVQGHAINVPGLQPSFLVGDDILSRTRLKERGDELRDLRTVGLAVNVTSEARLAEVRAREKELQILPASADDSVSRLRLRYYPALITPTAIQQ